MIDLSRTFRRNLRLGKGMVREFYEDLKISVYGEKEPIINYYHITKKQQAYYDLGEIISPSKAVEIDIEFALAENNLLFGSRTGYDTIDSYALYENRFDVGQAGEYFEGVFPSGKFCTIKLFDKKVFIDGVEVLNYSENSLSTQRLNAYIFDVNTNNQPTGTGNYAINSGAKLYDVRVYNENGTIKHNYKPQQDLTRKCSITGKVLQLKGTGTFDVAEYYT